MTSSSTLDQASHLASDILNDTRHELMASLRFLDVALWVMPFEPRRLTSTLTTNGVTLLYDPVKVIERYRDEPNEIVRDFLHLILHCVFRHPFDGAHANRELWDISCDIAVEAVAIDLLGSRLPCSSDANRNRALSKLAEACPNMTAPKLYALFENVIAQAEHAPANLSPSFVKGLGALFARDDHDSWPRGIPHEFKRRKVSGKEKLIPDDDPLKLKGEAEDRTDVDEEDDPTAAVNVAGAPAPSMGGSAAEGEVEGGDRFTAIESSELFDGFIMEDRAFEHADYEDLTWQDISGQIENDLEAFLGKPGVDTGSFSVNLAIETERPRYDYREFLKRFAVLSEEMKVSTEEFDYIYYTYGLTHYNNMPLVEPLEYQESKRVRDFVIAIDTSASCAGGLVKHFIEKTYDVLKSTSGFGRKLNVHIVQCDCEIRKVTKIESLRDLDDGFSEVQLRGFGGTDFRPVFDYIDERVRMREFKHLKGMIYLTDGLGRFPETAPDYDVVFVFVDDPEHDPHVPPWATKVVMREDQIYEL